MTWKKEDREGEKLVWEYDFECHESLCGYTEYNQGKSALLILNGERILTHGPNAGKREEHHLWLTVGDDFRPNEDGTRIVHKTGDEDRRMNDRAKAMKWIKSCIDAGVPLEERGTDSLDAVMYAGLSFHVMEEETSFKIRGEKMEGRQPVCTKYLGEVGGGGTSTPTADSDPDLSDKLGELATKMKADGNDHLDWVEKANTELGLPLDHPLLAEAGSIWSNA